MDPLALIDEENDTVNKQLVMINKEYNKIKTANKQKQALIYKLKQEINTDKRAFNSLSEDKYAIESKIQRLENYLDTVINKRKEEENFMKSYQYLLDRIKEDKNSLDKELRKQQSDLNQKKYFLNTESRKAKKLQERSLRNKSEILSLNEIIEKEKRIQEETLMLIEKKALEKSKAVLMLEESSRKREMIADAAQGQISNIETIEARQKLLLTQFWYSVLNKKLQVELEKGGVFEEPFLKIKITTGMQTVEEILTRFLTREEAYKDLVAAVKTSENNLEDLKRKFEESTNFLRTLSIKEGEEEIQVEEELVRQNKRSFLNYKEMVKKYTLLLQNLQEWAKKQLIAMEIETQDTETVDLLKIIDKENTKLMEKVKEKTASNKIFLEDILHMSTSGLLKKKDFMKYVEENCRITPRKFSTLDDNFSLLIGN